MYKLFRNKNSDLLLNKIQFYNFISYFTTNFLLYFLNLFSFIPKNKSKYILFVRSGGIGDIFHIYPILKAARDLNMVSDVLLFHLSDPIFFNQIFKSIYFNEIITRSNGDLNIFKKLFKRKYSSIFIMPTNNETIFSFLKKIIFLKLLFPLTPIFSSPLTIMPFYSHRKEFELNNVFSPREPQVIIDSFNKVFKTKFDLFYDIKIREVKNKLYAKKYICILVGTNRDTNRVNEKIWANLINSFSAKNIVFIGGKSEKRYSDSIIKLCNSKNIYHNFSGNLSIPESLFILKHSSLTLSHDTGLMHIASELNNKMLVFFSSRDISGRWFPRLNKNKILRSKVDCGFCLKDVCPINNECVNNSVKSYIINQKLKK